MEPFLKHARRWGALAAAVMFFALWCWAEAGRMGPNGGYGVNNSGFDTWSGTWPLVLMALAIATATWKPMASLVLTAALLAGQLAYVIPVMYPNYWAIYLGSFIALLFIMWTAPVRMRYVAAGANVIGAAVMAFLMLSWRYGAGVGWFGPLNGGDRGILGTHAWPLFALLLLIAGACAAAGLLLALYQDRGNLFRARERALQKRQAR